MTKYLFSKWPYLGQDGKKGNKKAKCPFRPFWLRFFKIFVQDMKVFTSVGKTLFCLLHKGHFLVKRVINEKGEGTLLPST